MKHPGTLSRSVLLFFLPVAVSLTSDAASAPPPPTVRVQGFVSDRSVGTPVPANGTFQMTFRLYDAAVGGNLVATSGPGPVQVTGGLYNADVAFPPPSFDGGNLFLEVQVNAETLTPRIPVVSVPYAYVAAQSTSVAPGGVTSASIAPGAVLSAGIAPGAVTADKLGIPCAEGESLVRSGGAWICRPAPHVCDPGAAPAQTIPCYDGPPGTRHQGICKDGEATCLPDGTGYGGGCAGWIGPTTEICGNGIDENCDGVIDDPIGQHSNGLGQLYNSCQPLGTPGDPTTYTDSMAVQAALASTLPGSVVGSFMCGFLQVYVRQQTTAPQACAIWAFQGMNAGHVRAASQCFCPTTSDPTWN